MTPPNRDNSFHPSRFSRSLLGRMLRRRATKETGDPHARVSPMLDDWTDGLHPEIRHEAARIVAEDKIRLHSHVHALNSSMAFGFNLFMPFCIGVAPPLAELIGQQLDRQLRVDRVVFEYAGPTDVLAEVAGAAPEANEPFTASDVAVFVRDQEGRHGVILVEVKLTEGEFSHCNGATSRGNRRKNVCGSAEMFFADPSACYLRHPYRAKRDRRYWTIFEQEFGSVREAFPGADLAGACPFRGDGQQPMRNHALALGLVQADVVDFAAFGLVHHDDNPDVVPGWEEYASTVADPATLFRLPASAVCDAANQALVADPAVGPWLRERYYFPGGGR